MTITARKGSTGHAAPNAPAPRKDDARDPGVRLLMDATGSSTRYQSAMRLFDR